MASAEPPPPPPRPPPSLPPPSHHPSSSSSSGGGGGRLPGAAPRAAAASSSLFSSFFSSSSSSSSASSAPPWLRHVRVGAPLVLLCVGGLAILSHFTANKVEAVDGRRRRASERQIHLEMAHRAVVGRLGLREGGEDLRAAPIPRPADE